MARPLIAVMEEAHQVVPPELRAMATGGGFGGSYGGSGRGFGGHGGGRGGGFGGYAGPSGANSLPVGHHF